MKQLYKIVQSLLHLFAVLFPQNIPRSCSEAEFPLGKTVARWCVVTRNNGAFNQDRMDDIADVRWMTNDELRQVQKRDDSSVISRLQSPYLRIFNSKIKMMLRKKEYCNWELIKSFYH